MCQLFLAKMHKKIDKNVHMHIFLTKYSIKIDLDFSVYYSMTNRNFNKVQ